MSEPFPAPDANALYEQGLALAQQGKAAEALAYYRQVLRAQPNHAQALINVGILLAQQGQRDEGIDYFRAAIRAQPDLAQAHQNLGVALAQQGQLDAAAAALRQALTLHADYPEACNNLATVLLQQRRPDEAVPLFEKAIALRPDYAEAYLNYGSILFDQRRRLEAVVALKQAVRLQPTSYEAHNKLGLAYSELGQFDKAEACYEEALRLHPRGVEAHNNLGSTYKEQGRLTEALAQYQLALWLDPKSASAHWNRSLAMLAAGDFERGWAEYEWRWQRVQQPRRFRQPAWDGSPLDGKTILLWMEQGLGDMIQFIRYAPLLHERGARVVVECPALLVPLFATCPGIDQLLAEGTPLPDFDVQVPLLSLPRLFGTTLKTIPNRVPYLSALPERVEHWKAKLDDCEAFKVGVVWQGNPHHGWDHHRSFKLTHLAPIAAVEGVQLVSLQKEFGTEQLANAPFPVTVLDDEPQAKQRDFVDTAAITESLDLVLSADTSTVHLAGALGRPVWVPLAAVSDWRWLRDRDESPWYPTLRLFRQQRLGDWEAVIARIAMELQHLRAARAGESPPCPAS